MNLRLTIMEVLRTGEAVFIPCESKSKQESVRSMAYQISRKHFNPSELDFVGISKITINNKLYIQIHRRELQVLYKMNSSGELVPFSLEQDTELDNIVERMKQDHISQEQIDTYIAEWKQEKIVSDLMGQ